MTFKAWLISKGFAVDEELGVEGSFTSDHLRRLHLQYTAEGYDEE